MLQESVGWDTQNLIREPSTSFKIYLMFLIVVCVATIIKLIRVWRGAPPFRLSSQAKNPDYLKLLRISSHSLSHWIGCTFLVWAILSSTAVYDVCRGMQNEKATGLAVILFVIQDFSIALSMALWVVLFVFLVRWHVSGRIARLRD
jgi:branched-subunit amino acid transport protein AzlD